MAWAGKVRTGWPGGLDWGPVGWIGGRRGMLCASQLTRLPHPTVSHSYGYGLLDAGAMVALAQNWTTVAPQRKCIIDILTEPK